MSINEVLFAIGKTWVKRLAVPLSRLLFVMYWKLGGLFWIHSNVSVASSVIEETAGQVGISLLWASQS